MLERSYGKQDLIPAILPIVGLDERGVISGFLGTGFVVGRDPLLMTCDHVIGPWPGPLGCIILSRNNELVRAEVHERDQSADVATLRLNEYRPPKWFSFFPHNDVFTNLPVLSIDYADTLCGLAGCQISVATRRGNVVKIHRAFDRFGPVGQAALELSFPALRGASGSPLLTETDFYVLGMIRDNVQRGYPAAALESVFDEAGSPIADTTYFMPAAVAVHARHLRRFAPP